MKAYLNPEEVTRLENEATNLRDRLLIRVLFYAGCRISEVLALKVEDIDFAQGTITVRHLKRWLKLSCPNCEARLGISHSFCPKCGLKLGEVTSNVLENRRQRALPVDSGTLDMLKEYIRLGGPTNRGGKLLLFPINRHRSWQLLKEYSQKAGLPRLINPETGKEHYISPHRLRDAFAVNAVKHDDSGDGLRMLQEHLGHTSIGTTMRYRKVAGEEHKDWYNKLWQDKETK